MSKFSTKIIALLLITALNTGSLLAIGETFAYFNDTEDSLINSIAVGTLDFSLSSGTFQLTPGESNEMLKTVSVVNEGSLDFQYSIYADNIQGDLCDDLLIKADNLETAGTDCATSSLSAFNCTGNQITDPLDNWEFAIIRTDENNSGTCDFDFVFDGKQISCPNGFSDTETLSSSIDFSNAQTGSQLVINEVYYDVDENNYGTEAKNEWLELYNNSSQTVNLKDWSLTDNSGNPEVITGNPSLAPGEFVVISHDASTCSNYWNSCKNKHINLGGNMAPGWLDNDGDELTLKDDLGNIVDFVAWEGYYTGWDMNAQEGESIARKTAGLDTDTPSDWQVLSSPNPGTNPGHENLPNIVLNEFLPNPSSFPYEYIELYNLDSKVYDLSGYYVETDSGIIPINLNTTAQYNSGLTTIDATGWLAITTPSNNDLNNFSDTLTLYTDTGEILDTISYPLNSNTSSTVPADKSIARIPDGTGGWVDPYPTPGGPNKEEINQEQENINTEEQTATTVVNPVALDVYINTPISTLVDILLKGEPEGVKFVVTSGVSHGELSDLEGMKITYTPDKDYSGKDQFTFQAYNEKKHSENAWVYIAIGEELEQEESTEEVSTTTKEIVEPITNESTTNKPITETGSMGGTNNTETTVTPEGNISVSTTKATTTDIEIATTTENIGNTGTSTEEKNATTTEKVKTNVSTTATSTLSEITTSTPFSTEKDVVNIETTSTTSDIENETTTVESIEALPKNLSAKATSTENQNTENNNSDQEKPQKTTEKSTIEQVKTKEDNDDSQKIEKDLEDSNNKEEGQTNNTKQEQENEE